MRIIETIFEQCGIELLEHNSLKPIVIIMHDTTFEVQQRLNVQQCFSTSTAR